MKVRQQGSFEVHCFISDGQRHPLPFVCKRHPLFFFSHSLFALSLSLSLSLVSAPVQALRDPQPIPHTALPASTIITVPALAVPDTHAIHRNNHDYGEDDITGNLQTNQVDQLEEMAEGKPHAPLYVWVTRPGDMAVDSVDNHDIYRKKNNHDDGEDDDLPRPE